MARYVDGRLIFPCRYMIDYWYLIVVGESRYANYAIKYDEVDNQEIAKSVGWDIMILRYPTIGGRYHICISLLIFDKT